MHIVLFWFVFYNIVDSYDSFTHIPHDCFTDFPYSSEVTLANMDKSISVTSQYNTTKRQTGVFNRDFMGMTWKNNFPIT